MLDSTYIEVFSGEDLSQARQVILVPPWLRNGSFHPCPEKSPGGLVEDLEIGFLASCTSGKAMASETWLFGLATIDNYQYGLKTISVWEDNPIGVYNFPRRIVSFAGKETGRQEFASSSTGSFSCDEPQDLGNHDSSKDGHHESMHLSRQQWRRKCRKIPLA